MHCRLVHTASIVLSIVGVASGANQGNTPALSGNFKFRLDGRPVRAISAESLTTYALIGDSLVRAPVYLSVVLGLGICGG